MQLHIETVNIHLPQRQKNMASAFFDALLRKAMDGGEEGQPVDAEIERAATGAFPKIGEYWPGQGGIYAGIARGWNGAADYPLILGIDAPAISVKWQAAIDHAKTIEADGHCDFRLPSKTESALLYANLKDLFDTDHWYWVGEQYSEDTAWIQFFNDGHQLYLDKDYEHRVRFVRGPSIL